VSFVTKFGGFPEHNFPNRLLFVVTLFSVIMIVQKVGVIRSRNDIDILF